MDDEQKLNEETADIEGLDRKLILTDQDGVETEFEFLDVVECDGKEYLVLIPTDSIDDGEVVIFRIEGEGEEETYVGVETEEEASKVFETFKEKAKDDYNFVD